MIETSPMIPPVEQESVPEMAQSASFWEQLGPEQLSLTQTARQLYELGAAEEADQNG